MGQFEYHWLALASWGYAFGFVWALILLIMAQLFRKDDEDDT